MRTRASIAGLAAATLATATALLAADLTWLGVVARDAYDTRLSTLKRPDAYLPAAGLFYALYVAAIVAYAVIPSTGPRQSVRRGAGMGLLAYGTYELTNWAVLRGWPGSLVPLDIAWGVALTATAALAGERALAFAARKAA